MPPCFGKPGPTETARAAVTGASAGHVKYLLCTHAHWDHFSLATWRELNAAFPNAETWLQRGFHGFLDDAPGVRYFDDQVRLDLGGEPLYLVHAPKHSPTDTMVIFRGTACTGDWELGTIHSVHDWTWFWAVPESRKLESIARMERFQAEQGYHIHSVYSVHANDRREAVDFPGLMAGTRAGQRPA
jgi:glyoxylase-like metal-dependent hydrolase (beta-lactamase superfamily II)